MYFDFEPEHHANSRVCILTCRLFVHRNGKATIDISWFSVSNFSIQELSITSIFRVFWTLFNFVTIITSVRCHWNLKKKIQHGISLRVEWLGSMWVFHDECILKVSPNVRLQTRYSRFNIERCRHRVYHSTQKKREKQNQTWKCHSPQCEQAENGFV